MSNYKLPTAYTPCDSYSASSTPPIPEAGKKSLLERLDSERKWLEAEKSSLLKCEMYQPHITALHDTVKEAATAIRDLTQALNDLLRAKHPQRQTPIQQARYLIDKYQETK